MENESLLFEKFLGIPNIIPRTFTDREMNERQLWYGLRDYILKYCKDHDIVYIEDMVNVLTDILCSFTLDDITPELDSHTNRGLFVSYNISPGENNPHTFIYFKLMFDKNPEQPHIINVNLFHYLQKKDNPTLLNFLNIGFRFTYQNDKEFKNSYAKKTIQNFIDTYRIKD